MSGIMSRLRAPRRRERAPGWPASGAMAADRGFLAALFIGILLLSPAGTPRPAMVGVLLLLIVLLGVALRWRVEPLIVVVLLIAGLGLRVAFIGGGFSDVLPVTGAAIDRMLDGLNPYGYGYPEAQPDGGPFVYGPLALLWYLPVHDDPRRLEFAVSLAILGVLALRGRPIGLAVYALAPALLTTASDGANDTSAGLFLLIALLVTVRLPLAGGVLLAAAVAFKPYAAAWLPPLVAWSGLGSLVAFAAGSAVFWGPAVLAWGIGPITSSVFLALQVHATSYYSLGYMLESLAGRSLPAEIFDRFRLLAGITVALLTAPFVRSGRAVILAGTLIYVLTLFSGYWATFSYLAAVAPVICWHLDEWLDLGERRVRLPGDPIGRLTVAVDARWPVRVGRAGIGRPFAAQRPVG